MTPSRRVTDHFTVQSVVLSFVGTGLIGAGVALKFLTNASDVLVITLAALGGVMIPGNHVASALRAWKGEK